ncbi:Vacuolar morphoproteinsis protein 6 [Steccherinum ochraceum]|uniref:Vacuolar morphoproteinsis protein 6 n=1 Tax=Steccherinum ochraceum TaxID=92696 RepID=A0A4R0RR08_9APHY|nr:Vacuolar morphoproteinsis protein 6 [Steccherinum ochraceum]
MAPFIAPQVVLAGLKERAESLLVQGDKLYVGTATGSLCIYTLNNDSGTESGNAGLVEIKKGLSRRAIEQLAYVQDINSLAVLFDSTVILYPLPTLSPPTSLLKAKPALSFALNTTVEREDDGKVHKSRGVPVVVTRLVVGCRRKVVIYSWRDGEPQEVQEAVLPHSPRNLAFVNADTVCFGYAPEYALFSLKSLALTEVSTPATIVSSSSSIGGMGMGALSGLGGYMTLGLGSKTVKPCVLNVSDNEVLIAKDNNGIFLGIDGKPSRTSSIDWPAPPEETAFVKPYVFSILPPGSVPASQVDHHSTESSPNLSFVPTPVVEIRSSISLQPAQTLPVPFSSPASATPTQIVRLITASPAAKSPLFLITTPTDRAAATAEGSTIWRITMKSWGEQVDELVESEAYSEAIALLETIDTAILPDKEERTRLVRALHAVSQFRSGHYKDAIDLFIELNINPAKVVALYPESVAGRLSVPQSEWIPLFGGPKKLLSSESTSSNDSNEDVPTTAETSSAPGPSASAVALQRPPSPHGSVRGIGMLRTGFDALVSAAKKDDDSVSIRSKRKEKLDKPQDNYKRSIEELMRYLTDRRPKVGGALGALNITNLQSHEMPKLSEASVDDLYSLPSIPLTSLSPEQLVRFAQIVDTALFKSYLAVRPGLLASLCRSGNWCEISEVEEMLRSREKFSELIFLYNGRKMHSEALGLLKELSEKETDMRDKLMPSVTYLQRLGPQYMDQIFESSHWIFEQDPEIGLEIFTSEEAELPRHDVVDYLEMIDLAICTKFLEFLITEREEVSADFHDRLAELYLRMTIQALQAGDEEKRRAVYTKLLEYIDTTQFYRPDRLFGLLPSDDLYEAKAILLGRLGRHDNALEVYVYKLQNFLKAEEYCKRIYDPNSPTSNIFLTLLRIYLRPTAQAPPSVNLLQPALELISRHSPRLDSVETLKLLPPLVTAQDVRAFLVEALRAPVFDTRVVKGISQARNEYLDRRLLTLQSKRVKVTDSRICPQCHKRLGYSVIAVHAPRGEVTHFHCREAFARRLKEVR